jgi:hypothetical protein
MKPKDVTPPTPAPALEALIAKLAKQHPTWTPEECQRRALVQLKGIRKRR